MERLLQTLLLCVFFYSTFAVQFLQIKKEEFDCPTQVPLIENECNKCYCTNRGELACTINECPQNKEKGIEECIQGTSWIVGCNKCWCIPIGTVCTNVFCYRYH